MNVALKARGLVKRYEDVVAVDGLDLEIMAGECFGVLGPNGAGKTTTVEIIEGLNKPDAGTVEILGRHWRRENERFLREKVGVALQETRLSDKLTVFETVRLFRSFFTEGMSATEVVALVGLTEKIGARVGKLSGGQKQRLALACALVGNPEVLFLDEPTTGLDPQARLHVWEIIESIRKRGCTVLLTTHYMEEAARLCDRVVILDHGKVIAQGTPAALIASLNADQVIEFRASQALDETNLAKVDGVTAVTRRDGAHVLTSKAIAATLPSLLETIGRHGATLTTLSTHQATLEDVFVHLTGRGLRDA